MNKPVILGGIPAITSKMTPYITIGAEEEAAVSAVMKSGKLSGFIGADCPGFYGGEMVQTLEKEWAEYFGIKYAISMNSATSCLYAAIAAVGIEPGDEIIVTPTTMTATVTGIILFNAVPVFIDICPRTYCIDPKQLENLISSRTKAIIGVDIYGYTADWDEIHKIIKRKGIKTIEDSAQSIGGRYKNKYSGTVADIGIYSLNRHKHIHCGEGGICVTNNEVFAQKLRLIRNHGEAVINNETKDISNIIGFNFRMTEIEAAIAKTQLKKLESLVEQRKKICKQIIDIYSNFKGFKMPITQFNGCSNIEHVFYYLCFQIDQEQLGITRENFVKALTMEGVPHGEGGYQPLYLQPMFQRKIALGKHGFPFTAEFFNKNISYKVGTCPVAEDMWFNKLFYFKIQNFSPNHNELDKFYEAVNKIYQHRHMIQKECEKISCL